MSKKKIKQYIAGKCDVCKHEHMTTDGGWIINAERKLFCHDNCFDLYLRTKKIERLTKRREHADSR